MPNSKHSTVFCATNVFTATEDKTALALLVGRHDRHPACKSSASTTP